MRRETSEKRVFALSQVLVCGECGRTLVGSSAHGKNRVHRYYVHSTKRGDVIECSRKRYSAEEIEEAVVNRLGEILERAGHFDQVAANIKKVVPVNPEEIQRQKSHVEKELQKVRLGIQRIFKLQSAMDAESEEIQLVAEELQQMGRTRKTLEQQLIELEAMTDQSCVVDQSIVSLKERIEQFNRGWKKASAVMKKTLMKDLIFHISVTPKGLQVEYRLAEDMNSNGSKGAKSVSQDSSGRVTSLPLQGRDKSSGTVPDSASTDAVDSDFGHKKTNLAAGSDCPRNRGNNLGIQKLQVVGNGRGAGT